MLTKKQHELLLFIHKRLSEDGVSPSFDEMKEALQLASKSGVHRLVSALEERAFRSETPILRTATHPQPPTTGRASAAELRAATVEGGTIRAPHIR